MHIYTHTLIGRPATLLYPPAKFLRASVVVVAHAGFLSSVSLSTPPPPSSSTDPAHHQPPAHHFYRPRTMIIITMGSFAGSVGLAAHHVLGDAGLAGYAAFLVVGGGSVYHAVRSLEAVEVFKEKYEAAYRECTKGIEPGSDQLGPKPMLNPLLMQDGDHDVDYYIEEAKQLLEPFREEVLAVLANAADPTGETVTVLSNTKGEEVSVPVRGVWGGRGGGGVPRCM